MADILARGMASTAIEKVVVVEHTVEQLPAGINYKGEVATLSDLPSNPEDGDAYTVVAEHNDEYAWGQKGTTKQWIKIGPDLEDVAYTGNYTDLHNTPTIPTVDVDKAYVDQEIEKVEGEIPDISGKQDTLIAGENISIAADGKTISATGGSEYYSGDGIYIDEDNAINCDEQMIRDWQLQGAQDVNVMNDGGQIIFETIYGGGISREPGEQFHQFTARPSSFSNNKITYTQSNDIENVYGACMYSGIINNPNTDEGIEFFGDNGIQRDGDWIHVSLGMFLNQPLSFWYNTQTQVNELRLDGDWQGYTSLGALQLKRVAIQTQPIDPNFVPIDWDTIQVNDDGQLFANGGSQVSGTNDGTNWTSLTIDDDTYAIPAGGSGGGKDTRPLPQMLDLDLNFDSTYKISRRNKNQPQNAFEFRTKADFLANIRIGGGFYRLNPYSGSSTTLTKQELSEALNATAGEWDSTIDIITYDLRYSNEGTRVSDSSYSLSKNSLVYFCQVTDTNDTFYGSYVYSNPQHFVYMLVFEFASNNMGNAYIDAFNSMTSSKLNGDEFGGSLFSGWCYSVHDGLLDLAKRYPLPTSTDGTYVLQCVVSNGEATYSWVAQ